MLIHINAPSASGTERTIEVCLRSSDTIGDLKARIEDEEWIPKDRQHLTYRNVKLEDGHTIESYGIEEGATIRLSRPSYTERDEAFYIYVQRTEEEVFRVRIKASDTIGSLKTRLWNGGVTTSDQQPLIFNQQRLEEDRNFFSYNVQENAVIRFPCKLDKVFPISIKPVTWDHDQYGGKVQIRPEVTGSDTIGSLKVRLWDGGLIPRSEQRLVFDGMCLENERTLSDYNIQEEATIFLPGQMAAAFPIHIRFPLGETIRILIDGINSVEHLKSQIQIEAWVPFDVQRLLFDGQELEDKKLLFDCNIQRGSTIDLQLPNDLHTPFSKWIAGSINITIKLVIGKSFVVRAKVDESIYVVKTRIMNVTPMAAYEQRLILKGKTLNDERTISEYEIEEDSTLYLVLRLRGGGGGRSDTKQSLGLIDIAQAISLWDWDGIMPGPRDTATGLRLSKGEVVTVGRVVNDEWYQGFDNKDICGYFPRSFVSVRKIESSDFKDDIHVDDTPIEELKVDVRNEGPPDKAPPKLLRILRSLRDPFRKESNRQPPQRLHGTTPKLSPSTPSPDSDRPDLPPSPVPAPSAFDRFVDGNRVLVQFSLDPKDNQRNYSLRATLSLNSGPDARFSALTFKVNMADGTILEISPEKVVGPGTEAEVIKDKNHQVSLSTSLQAGNAPISASVGASTSFSRAEHITFNRITHGTVQGSGVGSSMAYWVMKEDNGPAAEQGLDPVFELKIKLNVRPAIISFEVVTHILIKGSKSKTIQSGILDTSV